MAKMTGRLGELLVEQQLLDEHGWYPVRLDTAQMAANADIVALNREHRVSLQVKTTDAKTGHSHSNSVGFGYATAYLREGKPVFNSKPSPLVADVVVGVKYDSENSRFVVMPVAFAEKLCRFHCDYWYSVPTRSDRKRSPSFPIYLRFAGGGKLHEEYNEKVSRNILAFEDRWDILSKPVNKLHDEKAWSLLD